MKSPSPRSGSVARAGSIWRLSAIDRYISKMTLLSFLIVLVSLTGVIWITQALRNIDLMTSQGQTILVFLGISGLAIPLLVSIIAPIALLVAVMHSLNRLATDSEIIVVSAAGMPPLRLLRPVSPGDACREPDGCVHLAVSGAGVPACIAQVEYPHSVPTSSPTSSSRGNSSSWTS